MTPARYLSEKLHQYILSDDLFLQGNFQQTYYNTFSTIDK